MAINLFEGGVGLIDSSGRPKKLDERHTIAFVSKNIKYSIEYTSKLKKELYSKYKSKFPSEERFFAAMHAAGLYYCLHQHINTIPGVFICSEGINPGLIKHYLKEFMGTTYDDEKIQITSLRPIFGKKNPADRHAKKCRKNKEATIRLKLSHLKKFLN